MFKDSDITALYRICVSGEYLAYAARESLHELACLMIPGVYYSRHIVDKVHNVDHEKYLLQNIDNWS